jgi:flagella basal body P-ring formation protein FlgA
MWRCLLGSAALLVSVSICWSQQTVEARLRQAAEECVRAAVGVVPVSIRWVGEPLQQGSFGAEPVEVRCVSDSVLLARGRFVFELWSQGRWQGRIVLSGLVEVVGTEVRLRRSVGAGALVTPDDAECVVRRMALSEYWQRVRPEELGSVRVRRELPAGAILLRRDCLSRDGVRRGAYVTALLRLGAVEVRTRVQALEDGELGMRIRVRREGNNRLLIARVLDATTVEVEPMGYQP